jgi:hypothetical protein
MQTVYIYLKIDFLPYYPGKGVTERALLLKA